MLCLKIIQKGYLYFGQRWARYFIKIPAVPVLKNQKYRGTFVGTFQKKFKKESSALYFDFL